MTNYNKQQTKQKKLSNNSQTLTSLQKDSQTLKQPVSVKSAVNCYEQKSLPNNHAGRTRWRSLLSSRRQRLHWAIHSQGRARPPHQGVEGVRGDVPGSGHVAVHGHVRRASNCFRFIRRNESEGAQRRVRTAPVANQGRRNLRRDETAGAQRRIREALVANQEDSSSQGIHRTSSPNSCRIGGAGFLLDSLSTQRPRTEYFGYSSALTRTLQSCPVSSRRCAN